MCLAVRYDLHVLLVEHGKRCERCAKNGRPRKESHGPCPLRQLQRASKAQDVALQEATVKQERSGVDNVEEPEHVNGNSGVKQEAAAAKEVAVKEEQPDSSTDGGDAGQPCGKAGVNKEHARAGIKDEGLGHGSSSAGGVTMTGREDTEPMTKRLRVRRKT